MVSSKIMKKISSRSKECDKNRQKKSISLVFVTQFCTCFLEKMGVSVFMTDIPPKQSTDVNL